MLDVQQMMMWKVDYINIHTHYFQIRLIKSDDDDYIMVRPNDVRYAAAIKLFPLFFREDGLRRRKFCNISILFAYIDCD